MLKSFLSCIVRKNSHPRIEGADHEIWSVPFAYLTGPKIRPCFSSNCKGFTFGSNNAIIPIYREYYLLHVCSGKDIYQMPEIKFVLPVIGYIISGIALCFGAYTDYKSRTIPNSIPLIILLCGCLSPNTFLSQILNLVCMIVILLILNKLCHYKSGGRRFKAISFTAHSS